VGRQGQELLRQAVEAGAQKKADAARPVCALCQRALTRVSHGHERSFTSRFGEITVQRSRGYCRRCRKWRTPADAVLGLSESAGYSPAVQEMSALLASKMPVGEASVVLERLSGRKMPRATLDREARRQGERAQALRRQLDAHPVAPARQCELPLEPYRVASASVRMAKNLGRRGRGGAGRCTAAAGAAGDELTRVTGRIVKKLDRDFRLRDIQGSQADGHAFTSSG